MTPVGSITRGAGLAVAAVALHAGTGITAIAPVRRRCVPTLAGLTTGDTVALTFDDGPGIASTPRFLDRLADLRVPATFFVVGDMLKRAPHVTARASEAGHEIGVHGWSHRNQLRLSPRRTVEEVARTADLIERVTGERPRLFRPPYGVLTAAGVLAAKRAGLRPLLWSAWGRDWEAGATPASVLSHLDRGGLRPGATLLLHDCDATCAHGSWHSALDALPEIVAVIEARGGRLVRASAHLS